MEINKVAIIGLGALGILFGAQIAQKIGDDLTIIADQKRIKNYQNNGAAVFISDLTHPNHCSNLDHY